MGVAWKYWRWVKVDPARGRAVVPIAPARDFFHQQIGYGSDDEDVNDKATQVHLMKLVWHDPDEKNQRFAELCLRCFISNQIDWVCNDLAKRFGTLGGFEPSELWSLALDDVSVEDLRKAENSVVPRESLASQILQSFDPARAQLSTWCRQMTISYPALSAFLKANGIYLESDWSILNSTRPEHLRRILQQVYNMSSQGIEQTVIILESFQAVYRRDRLHKKQTQGSSGRCHPPTADQLNRMADLLRQKNIDIPTDKLLERLQAIAHFIRQSRRPQTVPLDHPNLPSLAQPEPDPAEAEQNIFLRQYRKELQAALGEAIAAVVEARVAYNKGRKPPKDAAFLLALRLLHCEGKAMGEIAQQVQLKQQYQVSRLLELKTLRADVRRILLDRLQQRIRELAADYIDPERLHRIDATLNAALEHEVERMITAAEKESTTAQSFQTTLFSKTLCRYLDPKE